MVTFQSFIWKRIFQLKMPFSQFQLFINGTAMLVRAVQALVICIRRNMKQRFGLSGIVYYLKKNIEYIHSSYFLAYLAAAASEAATNVRLSLVSRDCRYSAATSLESSAIRVIVSAG